MVCWPVGFGLSGRIVRIDGVGVQKRSPSGDLPLFVSASEKRRAAEIPPLRNNEDLYRYFSERLE